MKEADIRPKEIFAKYLELSRQDAESRFGSQVPRRDVPCPGCGQSAAAPAFLKDGFRYCSCSACGSLFVSPRPSEQALNAFYEDSPSASYWADVFFPVSMAARREHIFQPRVERILGLLDARGHDAATVIDVGAGYGLFLDEFRKRRPRSQCLAIEPGDKLAAVCRANGFETLQEPVERASAWHGRGDLVVCFEVLEHVYSTDAFLRSLFALVRPGGYAVLTTLGVDGFDIQLLWEKSKSVSPPHHLNFLSLRGFEQLFARCGFDGAEILTPGRLDVDIVANAAEEAPAILEGQRFLRTLLGASPQTRQAFQTFLAENQLSSHTWVMARRPSESR